MSDTLNIKRYRLTYGGANDSDLRRWKLRRVRERAASVAGGQRSEAMYASPART